MTGRIRALLGGGGLKELALRGVSMALVNFGGQNFLRLISNLILTRLLFPEAFGLMAIVAVFTSGLQMFSDLGIAASIIQSKRGDQPDFLNTAWTLQILRGVVLALGTVALAWPVAELYDEPLLLPIMLAMGLNPLISGFVTTNLATARRKIHLTRQTVIQLVSQAAGIVIMVILAWITRSVWSLVWGSLFTVALRVVLYQVYMPGIRNRLRWEPEAVREIFGFGKFIFLSTLVSFAITQGDRLILGLSISTGMLGVYFIGYTLGILPLMLMKTVTRAVIFPLYRMRPPAESDANRRNMLRARRMLVAALMAGCIALGAVGIPLIDFLYDDRYALAGPIIVLMSLALVPQILILPYGNVLLSQGDSRRMFHIQAATAVLQVALLVVGVPQFGIAAAVLAPGLAALGSYPLTVRYVRAYKGIDLRGDALFLSVGLVATGAICWVHRAALAGLFVP